MEPIVLFGIQLTMSLLIYVLIAAWYAAPRLAGLPKELALAPLLWVHAFAFGLGETLTHSDVSFARANSLDRWTGSPSDRLGKSRS